MRLHWRGVSRAEWEFSINFNGSRKHWKVQKCSTLWRQPIIASSVFVMSHIHIHVMRYFKFELHWVLPLQCKNTLNDLVAEFNSLRGRLSVKTNLQMSEIWCMRHIDSYFYGTFTINVIQLWNDTRLSKWWPFLILCELFFYQMRLSSLNVVLFA